MKRLTQFCAALLAVAAVSVALAADQPAPAGGPGKGPRGPGDLPLLRPRVEKDLALTADQQTKLATIKAAYEKDRDAWVAAHPADPKLREDLHAAHEAGDKAKMKELGDKLRDFNKPLRDLHKKYIDEVRAMLTDDQKAKLDASLLDANRRGGGHRNGGKPAGEKPAAD